MDPLSSVAIGVIVVATLYAVLRKALLSLVYAITVLTIFALQVVEPLVTFDLGLLYVPGRSPVPWTFITFQFVHGSLAHVLLNLTGFVFLTPVFEERVGSLPWAVLFFLGGAVGALSMIALSGGAFLLVGASAGLLCLLGAYGRLYRRERITLFLPVRGMPSLPVLYVVIGFLVLETILSLVPPGGLQGIAWAGHVGGLAFGFAAGPLVSRLSGRKARPVRPAHLEGLQDLATTPELRSSLEQATRADLPEVRQAWVEQFVRAVRCPKCGGPVRSSWGALRSDCGWRRPVRLR